MVIRTLKFPPWRWSHVSLVMWLAAVLTNTRGYSTGAPLDACEHMLPQHGALPQGDRQSLGVSISTSVLGEFQQTTFVQVTLKGTRDKLFTGFLIQARHVGSSAPVGSFVRLPDGQTGLACGNVTDSTITHSEASQKIEIGLVWKSSKMMDATNLMFTATIVRSYGVFWVNVTSDVLFPSETTTPGEKDDDVDTTLISSTTEPLTLETHITTEDGSVSSGSYTIAEQMSTISGTVTNISTEFATDFAVVTIFTEDDNNATSPQISTLTEFEIIQTSLETTAMGTEEFTSVTEDITIQRNVSDKETIASTSATPNSDNITTSLTTVSFMSTSSISSQNASAPLSTPRTVTTHLYSTSNQNDSFVSDLMTSATRNMTEIIETRVTSESPSTTSPVTGTVNFTRATEISTVMTSESPGVKSTSTSAASTIDVTSTITPENTSSVASATADLFTTSETVSTAQTTLRDVLSTTRQDVSITTDTSHSRNVTLFMNDSTTNLPDLSTTSVVVVDASTVIDSATDTNNATTPTLVTYETPMTTSQLSITPSLTTASPLATADSITGISQAMPSVSMTTSVITTTEETVKETIAITETHTTDSPSTNSTSRATTYLAATSTSPVTNTSNTINSSVASSSSVHSATVSSAVSPEANDTSTVPTLSLNPSHEYTAYSTDGASTTTYSPTSEVTVHTSRPMTTELYNRTAQQSRVPSTETEAQGTTSSLATSDPNATRANIPIQRTSVISVPSPTTTTQEPIMEQTNQVYLRFRISGEEFTDALKDPNTSEYRALAAEVVQVMERVYKENDDITSINVIKFLRGSVIPEVQLVFESQLNDSAKLSVVDVMYTAVEESGGKLGNFTVDNVAALNDDGVFQQVDVCYLLPCPASLYCYSDAGQCWLTCEYNHNYCLNGGTCLDPTGNSTFATCSCAEDYDGKRCDVMVIPGSNENGNLIITIVASMCGILAILFGTLSAILACWFRRLKQSKRILDDPHQDARCQVEERNSMSQLRSRSWSMTWSRTWSRSWSRSHHERTNRYDGNDIELNEIGARASYMTTGAGLPRTLVPIPDDNSSSESVFCITDSDSDSERLVRPRIIEGGVTFPLFESLQGSIPDLLSSAADYELDIMQQMPHRPLTDSVRRQSVSFSDIQQVITDDDRIGWENFTFGNAANDDTNNNFQVRWDFQVEGVSPDGIDDDAGGVEHGRETAA